MALNARLGSRLCSKLGLFSEYKQFVELQIKTAWGKQFQALNIDFQDIFLGQNEDYESVLKGFIEKTIDDKNLSANLEKFTKAFGPIPLERSLELLVKIALTNPALDPILDEATDKVGVNEKLFTQVKSQVDHALGKLP